MNTFKVTLMLFLIIATSKAQTPIDSNLSKHYKFATSIGIGIGQDYGGIGANVLYYPTAKLGFFGGLGYAFAGVGYNVGAKFRTQTKKETPKIDTYLTAMYGYNAAVAVKGASQYNKLFYGPSVGVGVDFNPNSNSRKGYWSFAILYPFRSSAVDHYFDDLKTNKGVKFENELFPISLSIGYRIKIN